MCEYLDKSNADFFAGIEPMDVFSVDLRILSYSHLTPGFFLHNEDSSHAIFDLFT